MKGWKVLRDNGRGKRYSCRAYSWSLKLGGSEKWSISYPVGEEAFPKVKGSKLFFFKTKKEALAFAKTTEIVVPCIATGVTKVKWVGWNIAKMKDFWKQRSKSEFRSKAPKGTWFAESITCLK